MEEGVYLLKLELNNVRCFGENAILDLSNEKGKWEKWTIILGNNGTGKTTLLQIISLLEANKSIDSEKIFDELNSPFPSNISVGIAYKPIITDKRNYYETLLSQQFNDFTIQAITDLKSYSSNENFYFKYFKNQGPMFPYRYDERILIMKMYGYGANRFMSRNSLTESKSENSATLFEDDAKLINAEEWLLQLDYSASKSSPIQGFARQRRDQVKEILREVLPDIENIRFTEPTKSNLKTTVEFQTPYGWVTIHQLSLGYKTMVAWMVDLAARLFERYPDSDNPLAEPAIVLVDEIDLHMHPKWQRKIFDYLSEKFPKTQFIVTAHSPLIVQSAPKDANIVLLRREGDHVVIDNDIQSVHNWRIDQILNSDLFGNITQLPPDEEKWMDERVQLIQKGNLTDTEKQRLAELNEKAYDLPTADNQRDIEAMQIIRDAADYLKSKKTGTPA